MVGENKLKKLLVIILFLLPSLGGVIFFNLLPIGISALVSLTDWDLLGKPDFVGLSNYIKVFTEEKSYIAFANIFKFLIGYIPLVLGLGLLFAVLLNLNLKGVKAYRTMFFIPVITSWVAVSIIWRWLLNGNTGLINYLLSLIGVQGPVWLSDFFWAMPAVIMASVWKDVGFVTIILLSGLADISNEYYEAARIDGASALHQFFRITIPLLTPTIYFVLVISLINSFQLFDQVMVMTGGGPAGSTSTMVEQIYKNAFNNYKMGFAAAQSWILFIVIFISTIVMNRLQKRWVSYESN